MVDNPTPAVEVTQEDREAASRYLMETHGYDCGKAIREGRSDHTVTPQAFARHRIAHSPSRGGEVEKLREAKQHAVELEQCSLFVDSPPLAKAMTDAAAFLRTLASPPPVEGQQGTFACPICGQDTPHHHTPAVVDAYQNKGSRA